MFRNVKVGALTACLSFAAGAAALVAPDPSTASVKSDFVVDVAKPSVQRQINARTVRPDAQGRYMTIVRFVEASAAAYRGGVPGLAATSARERGDAQFDINAPHVRAYLQYLEGRHASHLGAIRDLIGRDPQVRFSYLNALNAVAVPLSLDEANKIQELDFVRSVHLDEERQMDSDRGPQFIGAPAFWNGQTTSGNSNRGEGVIIGVIDSGVNHDHPSFADIAEIGGYDHTNPNGAGNYFGLCVATPSLCNDKLIGSYNFSTGTGSEDADGHGSHTASTAGGNPVNATINGLSVPISGVAPRANLINYRVCAPGCPGSASIASVNQGIADGVDVFNYSISGSDAPWQDPVDLAFLDAYDAGIFVSASAGNDGPGASTVAKTGPWNASVANISHDRVFGFRSDLTAPAAPPANTQDVTLVPGSAPINTTPIVNAPLIVSPNFANPGADGCDLAGGAEPYPAGTFLRAGVPAIAVLGLDAATTQCGSVLRRQNALDAGAAGVIFVDNLHLNLGASGTSWAMKASDWAAFAAHVANDPTTATISISGTFEVRPGGVGDVVNEGSSRGPSQFNLIKPDYGAPGTAVLAAVLDADGGFDLLSGTSMAAPHGAGAAALIIAEHPTWSPAEVKSAIALTASPDAMVKEDGETPADPFDRGSGRINLTRAALIGAVMDETTANYEAADPGIGGDPRTLNQPSIMDGECIESCTFTRTVTSVLPTSANYVVSTSAPSGVDIDVSPASFALGAGLSQALTITVTVDTDVATPDEWAFGEIRLTPVGATSTVLNESFTGTTFPPTGWTRVKTQGTGAVTWVRTTTAGQFNSAPAGTRRTFSAAAEGFQEDWLITPPIALGNNSQLNYLDRSQFPTFYVGHTVHVSDGSCNPADGDFVEVAEAGINANDTAFFPKGAPLTAFDNETVCIGFVYEGLDADAWNVDDIVVTTAGSSPLPALRMPVAITPVVADPVLEVTPTSVSATADEGSAALTRNVELTNTGGAPLEWEISSDPTLLALRPGRVTPVQTTPLPSNFDRSRLRQQKRDDAQSTPTPSGSLPGGPSITHSVSNAITPLNSIACFNNVDVFTTDNSFWRVFTLSDFGITTDFPVHSVTVGIEDLSVAGDVQVKLYTLTGAFVQANLTEIGSATLTANAQSGTLLTIPLSVTVPAGSTLVLELVAPDFTGEPGSVFFAGSNTAGETGPSFISSVDCGIVEPTPISDVAPVNVDLVMSVNGALDVDCGVNGNADWATAAPISGTLAPDASADVTLTLDPSELSAGTHETNLCLASNDPATPLTVVPVTLTLDPAPVIAFSETSLEGTALPGGTDSTTFDIQNIGGEQLDWTTGEADPQPAGSPPVMLFDNGPLITHPGGGPGGQNMSLLQTTLGMNIIGVAGLLRTADEFTVNDPDGWEIASLRAFAYQTGSATSPFNGITVRIWDGPPDDPASTVVFGDTTTPRFAATGNANIFRATEAAPTGLTRHIRTIDANIGTTLPPGTYWADWALTVSAGNAFAAPVTILGETTTGNAKQFDPTVGIEEWFEVIDTDGTNTPQGMPFQLFGQSADTCVDGATIPWLEVTPAGGSTAAGAASTVTVDFDATGLVPGTYEAKVCVFSNASNLPRASLPVSFEVTAPEITLSPSTLPNGTYNAAYSATVTASGDGSTPPFTYVLTGDVPSGLGINASSGEISGTPTEAGSFVIEVEATDSTTVVNGGPFSGTREYTLVIDPASQTIDFAPLADRPLPNSPFAVSATATSGLTVAFASDTAAVCTVAGTQVTLIEVGTCSIRASQAGDANYAPATDVVRSFEVIDPTITIAPATLDPATIDLPYSVTFSASGAGSTAPYTYALKSGSLPPGLTLAANGQLTGTPTTLGSFNFAIIATDSTPNGSGGPFSGSRGYTLVVQDTAIFFDGFEDVINLVKLEFAEAGVKRVSLPLADSLMKLPDGQIVTAAHISLQQRLVGALQLRCGMDRCEARLVSAMKGGWSAGAWWPVAREPFSVEFTLAPDTVTGAKPLD
jgi:subtilisin family serine protease